MFSRCYMTKKKTMKTQLENHKTEEIYLKFSHVSIAKLK